MLTIVEYMQLVCFFKQKTAYEMRISDWSSDVCSSGLMAVGHVRYSTTGGAGLRNVQPLYADLASGGFAAVGTSAADSWLRMMVEHRKGGVVMAQILLR